MAVKAGYVFFRMATLVTSGLFYRGVCGPIAQKSPTPAMTIKTTADASGMGGNNPSSYMPPGATEKVFDWWGIIKSTKLGAQYDDYFERQNLGQIIYFGTSDLTLLTNAVDLGKQVQSWSTSVRLCAIQSETHSDPDVLSDRPAGAGPAGWCARRS